MQLHQLAYALAVAEEESFTRAADRLHLAQPSLSRQIRLLEHELGVLLFNRGPGQGRVTLTADGAALLPFMQRVLASTSASTRCMNGRRAASDQKRITGACSETSQARGHTDITPTLG